MNKTQFIDKVAQSAHLNKASASRAVDAMFEAISNTLRSGDTVTLTGFGTFSISNRVARTGRNPRTGETMSISASRNPRFKAGKGLKEAVN